MNRVLIIDDENEVCHLLRQMFEREGYEVVEASGGKSGLKLFREHPTDVVVTDIIMPEKDGLEVIEEIRTDFPSTKIIAISGGGQLDPRLYLDLARSFGAFRTLQKPFGLEEVVAVVKELTDNGNGSQKNLGTRYAKSTVRATNI